MAKSKQMHVVSNTHWDREWRYSFQRIRGLLVDMLDKLIDLMERDPDYKYYHLDSQTIPLEDYLALRPEKAERLKKLIADGRLLVGPWYILPDEFLVGGESLVRNLLRGHRVARQFGEPMKVGYSPFSWGQISQLPQLYQGFGIDTAMFYRGINRVEAPQAEFIWEGADGTCVLASRFSAWPRYNFWYLVYRPVLLGLTPQDRKRTWNEGGLPCRPCGPDARLADYHLLNPTTGWDEAKLNQFAPQALADIEADVATTQALWMQGHDSSAPVPQEPRLIEAMRRLFPDRDIQHSTLTSYINAVKAELSVNNVPLKKLTGEMRYVDVDGRMMGMFGYVTSARTYIKQQNMQAELLLQRWAEPWAVAAAVLAGAPFPDTALDLAWGTLLSNQGHDSIGGCSVDPVHEDMEYHYRQVREIAGDRLRRAHEAIISRLNTASAPDALHLTGFSALPHDSGGVHSVDIDLPAGLPDRGLDLVDDAGQPVAFQETGRQSIYPILQQPVDSPLSFTMTRVTGYVDWPAIPALGWRTLRVLPTATPRRAQGTLRTGPASARNAQVDIAIQADGTFTLTELASSRVYRNLGYAWDEGEWGNPWFHWSPVRDERVVSLGQPARITVLEDGPLAVTFRVEQTLDLPVAALAEGKGRSAERKPLVLTHDMTLRQGARRVDVATRFDNTVRDHRLRLAFPTDLTQARSHWADTPFDVVRRPVARPDTTTYHEDPMFDFPQRSLVDVSDGQHGLALLTEGLTEFEVTDDPSRTIFLTLVRAFQLRICIVTDEWVEFPDMDGSQCLRPHTFRWALMPHAGTWDQAGVLSEAEAFLHPPRPYQHGGHAGDLPAVQGLLRLDPPVLQLAGLKRAEDSAGWVVRLWNPTETAVEGFLHWNAPLSRVEMVTLEETEAKAVPGVANGRVPLKLGAKQILTLRLQRP